MSEPPEPTPNPEPEPGWLPPEPGGWPPPDQPPAAAPPPGYAQPLRYGLPPGYELTRAGQALAVGPAPMLMSFAPPVKQSRLTIAFRFIMIIPQFVVLWALLIAAEVIVFIGWFAALFTGSLPEWAHTFITGVLRWQFRVYAYEFFLTGTYPPFSLDDDEIYPVRLVTARARLNRFAVFFRVILLIPAAIVVIVASYGVGVLAFFVWLIALVAGRLPGSLHEALAALLRYEMRYIGFAFMVTGVYPWWGLYGDADRPARDTARPDTAPAQTAVPSGATTPLSLADPWRLVLSGGAKALVSVALVLGVAAIVTVAVVTPQAPSSPVTAFSNARALVLVEEAYSHLETSSSKFESAVEACSSQLSCVTAQDRTEAAALRTFAAAISSAGISGQPATDASRLVSDASGAEASLTELSTSTSVSQYESDYTSSSLEAQLNALDTNYGKLLHDLGS